MTVQTVSLLFQYINIDQVIVLLFLLVTLIVGIIAGRGIKDITDYAIANKTYGTPVLVLTLMATMIGGGSTTGATAQIFTEGVIYSLAEGIGLFIALIVLGRFIASKFDHRFEGMLSISDMVRYFYGSYAEKFSGILGYIFCIGIFSAQLIAMGHLAANFLGISYLNAVIITGTLVITYSIAGGIRAVAITDVFQFAVLIVLVPIIANIVTVEAGGLSQVFDQEVVANHLQIANHPRLTEYTSLFIYLCLPTGFISPFLVQRYLMTKSPQQASYITYIYAILSVALTFMVTCMAFSALHLFPDTEPKLVIPAIIDTLLPAGAKGLAIAGMLAVIMSTADSALNSGAILIAHNVLPESIFKSARAKLGLMKICTLISGITALMIATRNYNIALTILIAEALFISISVPITLGVLRFKVNKCCFWVCTLANIAAFVSAKVYEIPEFSIPLVCAVISIFSFLTTCYITNRRTILAEPENGHISQSNRRPYNICFPTPRNILNYSTGKINKAGANYMAFGIFCCVNYIVPFFMWTVGEPVHYPIMLSLRIIGGFLCVGLLLKDYWPEYMKKYFPVYWHFTLMFCLSFVTSVMFLLMDANAEWLINLALAIMLLIMLVDWVSFVLISCLGVSTGYIFYTFFIGIPSINTDFHNMYLLAYVCVFSTMIGTIFARKKEATAEEKLQTMQLIGGSIAHEVKGPFDTGQMQLEMLQNMLKAKLKPEETRTRKKREHYVFQMSAPEYKMLRSISNDLTKVFTRGRKTIDMLLMSMKDKIVADDVEEYSVNECIREALSEYYMGKDQKQNITLKPGNDFRFIGSKHFFKHVIFNLIQNTFKYAGKDAAIEIRLEGNKLHFKDNGTGIAPAKLPHIFDKFHTTTQTGTGIGLAFCKMVMENLGGEIKCKSEPGKYTEFTLVFPKPDR